MREVEEQTKEERKAAVGPRPACPRSMASLASIGIRFSRDMKQICHEIYQMMLDKAFQKENFSSSLLGLSSTNSNYLYLIIWLKFFNNLTKIDVNAIIIYY